MSNSIYLCDQVVVHEEMLVHDAISEKNMVFLKYLVENGANINERDLEGFTPLLNAVYYNFVDGVEFLIKIGAPIDDNSDGQTPLILATRQGNDKIIKILVENGADVNKSDKHGNTPLHLSTKAGNLKGVKLLIKYGANINAIHIGWTALIYSVYNRHADMSRYLLDNGSDVNAGSKHYRGIFDVADFTDKNMVKLLIENGVDTNGFQKHPDIINAIKTYWSPRIHHLYSKKTRDKIITTIKLALKENQLRRLPKDILLYVCSFVAKTRF